MNGVDVIILAVLTASALNGFAQGFIVSLALIAGAFVALAAARLEYGVVRDFLQLFVPYSRWVTVVAYLVVFCVIWAVIVVLARVLRRVARLLFLGIFDRLGGAIVGLLVGVVTVELLLYLGRRAPSQDLHRLIALSSLAPTFLHAVPYIDKLFPHVA